MAFPGLCGRLCAVVGISSVLVPVLVGLLVQHLIADVPQLGGPAGRAAFDAPEAGARICTNPVLPGTPVLEGFPFVCGLQEVSAAESPLQVFAYIQPNGSWCWSNAGLIVNRASKQSVLVDTLSDERLTARMLNQMAPHLAAAPLETLVHTHGDLDHTYGNALVLDRVQQVLVSAGAAKSISTLPPAIFYHRAVAVGHYFWHLVANQQTHTLKGWASDLLGRVTHGGLRAGIIKFLGFCRAGEFFSPFLFHEVTFTPQMMTNSNKMTVFASDRTQLDLGGLPVDIIETPPAHSGGDTIVVVPAARVAFTGDLLFLGSSPIMWHGPAQNFLDALQMLAILDVDYFVPGHGPVADLTTVTLSKAYWRHVQHTAAACFAAGTDVWACGYTAVEALPAPFDSWGDPERLLVNLFVEMSHLNATAHGDVYKLPAAAKPALLASMGEYRVRATLPNKGL